MGRRHGDVSVRLVGIIDFTVLRSSVVANSFCSDFILLLCIMFFVNGLTYLMCVEKFILVRILS